MCFYEPWCNKLKEILLAVVRQQAVGSNLGTWQGPVVDGRKAVESPCVDHIGPTSTFSMGGGGPAREYQKYQTVI